MMKARQLFSAVLTLLVASLATGQTNEISLAEHTYGIDEARQLIVAFLPESLNETTIADPDNFTIQLGANRLSLQSSYNAVTYTDSYDVELQGVGYTLYFTRLPVITIDPADSIVDEPKRLASFTYADDEQVYSSWCGIEIRGGSSQSFPKKTYDLELWDDQSGDDTDSESFGTLRKDDDWILDALYNEPLRLRSNLAHQLWLDIHTPYYLADDDRAKAGADVLYAEVFVDGAYNGIYNLSEQVDRKQLRVKKLDDDTGIRGELYKAESHDNTRWNGVRPIDNTRDKWMGYEVKHPDADDIIDWSALYNAIDFVANSDDSDFMNGIDQVVYIDNAMDYFIFLNLLRALDNTGKNIYIAKYDTGEPYFMVPWDLDGVLGTQWEGLQDSYAEGIIGNTLYDRLLALDPQDFRQSLKDRYDELRSTVLSDNSLQDRLDQRYTLLETERIYEREAIVHGNYSFSLDDLNYTKDWLERRLNFLDDYFATLTSTDDTISDQLQIWPVPASQQIHVGNPTLVDRPFFIYSTTGQLVSSGQLALNLTIDISHLQPGQYVLQIEEGAASILIVR